MVRKTQKCLSCSRKKLFGKNHCKKCLTRIRKRPVDWYKKNPEKGIRSICFTGIRRAIRLKVLKKAEIIKFVKSLP